jgi:hypothetical protein
MSYKRGEFYTKDKDLQRYLDRLSVNRIVTLPPRVAMDIGRTKAIRWIRDVDKKDPLIIIGHDRKLDVSLIKIREPVKIVKKGNKYVFSI